MIINLIKKIIAFGIVGMVTAGIFATSSFFALDYNKNDRPGYLSKRGNLESGSIATFWVYHNFERYYDQETADAYKTSVESGDYSYIYNKLGSTNPIYNMADVCKTDGGQSLLYDDSGDESFMVERTIQKIYAKTGCILNYSQLKQLAVNKGYTTDYKYTVGQYLLNECTVTTADCNAVKGTSSATTSTSQAIYNLSDYADEFDATYYYNRYPDLQKAIGNDAQALLEHWVKYGKTEGRIAKAQ